MIHHGTCSLVPNSVKKKSRASVQRKSAEQRYQMTSKYLFQRERERERERERDRQTDRQKVRGYIYIYIYIYI